MKVNQCSTKQYNDFLKSKVVEDIPTGIDVSVSQLNPMLFDFQRDIVCWALKIGRAAIFADCGLGKTPMQLEWAKHIKGNVLILAPLAVSQQTVREGEKFGIEVNYCRNQQQINSKITITNYEMLDKFDADYFNGIVLDESSILKSYTGKYRNDIINKFCNTSFRLACTATPAPNDYMELGNHSEFLGIKNRVEMLSMFFVHDGGETQKWRLKRHAEDEFWKWLCSWAVMLRKPSDLGYKDEGFILPQLHIKEIIVPVNTNESTNGLLFRLPAQTLEERRYERKLTISKRASKCGEIINGSTEYWLIWCNLNAESSFLKNTIKGAIEIKGSDKNEYKAQTMLDFASGKIQRLVTKPKIAGFGMNWQHCSNIAFVGLSDSYEQFYQAVRRCWRFGQKREVACYIITAETEGAVVANIKRKEADAKKMATEMVKHMHVYNEQNIRNKPSKKHTLKTQKVTTQSCELYLGDCIALCRKFKKDTFHYSIFSPPFADLYTYGDKIEDLGNCKNYKEFFKHFNFLADELMRIIMPGRLISFHCMNLPTSKTRDGFIGIKDFRGELIRLFQSVGFIFHSEVCIWKNPVVAVSRTKALGLLHKQMKKDSAMSRQGIPDYLVTMRKPGNNPEPIKGKLTYFCGDKTTFQRQGKLSIDIWQKYASPVWMDINPSRTLQKISAREHKDEKHICPLQLDIIERALQLWTNEEDLVFSPFMGIGSEGYIAVKMGRRFCGIELKESYFKQAVKNLNKAENERKSSMLFLTA